MSLASDTPFTMPVVPAGVSAGNSNSGTGWGNDGSWWIIILFLFIFAGGWNRNGWGGNGNGAMPTGSGAIDNYVLASDFAQVERKLDTVQQGLCDGFYATAQQINGVQNTMCQGFNGVNTSILTNGNATQMAIMQGNNAIQAQLADCCCQTQRQVERGFADTNYNLATQACDTRNTIQTSTRDLIENQNSNARAILDKLTAQEIAAKDAQIQAQNQQIFGLQLAASQQAQNNYLVNQLKPCPVPAYITCNPWSGQTYGCCTTTCGC